MTDEEFHNKRRMIGEIMVCVRANGLSPPGEFLLMLAFRSVAELRQICQELHIQVEESSHGTSG